MNGLVRKMLRFLGWGALAMVLLCACAWRAKAETAANAPAQSAQATIQACAEVLTGGRQYLSCEETGSIRASFQAKVTEWNGYSFPKATTFDRFSVTDLDADGLPELLLELVDTEGYPFGYELFRYEGGEVYGYPFVARAMERVTRQGDVFASSGADDNGWYQVRFSGEKVQWTETCHTESNSDHTKVSYWIGDRETTKADYDTQAAQINSREQIVWLSYSTDNLRAVVAKFSQAE